MRRNWIENFYNYGSLTIERILFEYDRILITFVCLDSIGNRFFCHCTDPIRENTWLVTPVSNSELATLIETESPLNSFWESKAEVVLAISDGNEMIYEPFIGKKIPQDELPAPDYALENDCEDYVRQLRAHAVIIDFQHKEQVGVKLPNRTKTMKKAAKAQKTSFNRINVSDRRKRIIMG
jgi:hypothetical protein